MYCALVYFLILALCKLFVCLLPYANVFTSLLIYFFENRPIPFLHARVRKRLQFYCIYFVLLYILLRMHVVFYCVRFSFSVLSQEIGWEERLQNDLFCVSWYIKPRPLTWKTIILQCYYTVGWVI